VEGGGWGEECTFFDGFFASYLKGLSWLLINFKWQSKSVIFLQILLNNHRFWA
jgi:hypothetical protein